MYDAAVEREGSEQASEQTTGEDMVTFSVPHLYKFLLDLGVASA